MKNNINAILFLVILYSIIPCHSFADGKVTKKKFGAYTVILSQSFENGVGKILIRKGKEKVFEESEVDNHYYFGNNFDEALNGTDPYSGHNITGNGVPNLVISNWTGGAHCCHFLDIFELGKKFRKIITVEANSSNIRFVDLDHDGVPEIEFWDGSIDYLFACFADSPGGRVILKFQNDQYEVSTNLMKKPVPSEKQLIAIKKRISVAFKKQNPDLPFEFLSSMMDLSYSGHLELALKTANEVWPVEKPGLLKFKQDFTGALQDSLYWKNF